MLLAYLCPWNCEQNASAVTSAGWKGRDSLWVLGQRGGLPRMDYLFLFCFSGSASVSRPITHQFSMPTATQPPGDLSLLGFELLLLNPQSGQQPSQRHWCSVTFTSSCETLYRKYFLEGHTEHCGCKSKARLWGRLQGHHSTDTAVDLSTVAPVSRPVISTAEYWKLQNQEVKKVVLQ